MAKRKTSALVPSTNQMVALAAPVSARVQIRDVLLAESVVRWRPSREGLPKQLSLSVDVRTEGSEKNRAVHVLPRFTLIGREDPDSNEESLRIEAMFMVMYHIPTLDGLKKENIDAFGKMNGIYNVWPYWREFVQSMTVRMGLPPLTIPSYRPLAGGVSRPANGSALPSQAAARSTRNRNGESEAPRNAPKRGK